MKDDYSITIEKLLKVVHSYTDPIKINVVIGTAFWEFPEAKRMKDFYLVDFYSQLMDNSAKIEERLMKYYKDVPVWNLTVWVDGPYSSKGGRSFSCGIKANCHYKDIRNGWIAEQADIKRAKRREYQVNRKRKRALQEEPECQNQHKNK